MKYGYNATLQYYVELAMEQAPPTPDAEPSKAAQLAIELNKNRELTRKLYALRGEAPPNDAACAPRPPLPTPAVKTPPCCSRCIRAATPPRRDGSRPRRRSGLPASSHAPLSGPCTESCITNRRHHIHRRGLVGIV